jgi:hypothetical protein
MPEEHRIVYEEQIVELKREHPEATIIQLPEENPTEVIAEVPLNAFVTSQGTAICLIRESLPHYHKERVEVYDMLSGVLVISFLLPGHATPCRVELTPSMAPLIIPPWTPHFAKAYNATAKDVPKVRVISSPAWTKEDHHLLKTLYDLLPQRSA